MCPTPAEEGAMNEMMALVAAVLFSGGDAPGMNAFLQAFVRLGLNRYRATVLGVKNGFRGLVSLGDQLRAQQTTVAEIRQDLAAHGGLAGVLRPEQHLVELDRASVSGLVGR